MTNDPISLCFRSLRFWSQLKMVKALYTKRRR